jgi:hypothetical protein
MIGINELIQLCQQSYYSCMTNWRMAYLAVILQCCDKQSTASTAGYQVGRAAAKKLTYRPKKNNVSITAEFSNNINCHWKSQYIYAGPCMILKLISSRVLSELRSFLRLPTTIRFQCLELHCSLVPLRTSWELSRCVFDENETEDKMRNEENLFLLHSWNMICSK